MANRKTGWDALKESYANSRDAKSREAYSREPDNAAPSSGWEALKRSYANSKPGPGYKAPTTSRSNTTTASRTTTENNRSTTTSNRNANSESYMDQALNMAQERAAQQKYYIPQGYTESVSRNYAGESSGRGQTPRYTTPYENAGRNLYDNDYVPEDYAAYNKATEAELQTFSMPREDRDKLINDYVEAAKAYENNTWDEAKYRPAIEAVEKAGGIEKLYTEQQADAENDREYGRQLRGIDLDSMSRLQRFGKAWGGFAAGTAEQLGASGLGLAASEMNTAALNAASEDSPASYRDAMKKVATTWYYGIVNGADNSALEDNVRKVASYVGGDAYADAVIKKIRERADEDIRSGGEMGFSSDILDDVALDDNALWNNLQDTISESGIYEGINNLQTSSAEHIQQAKDYNNMQDLIGSNAADYVIEGGVSTAQNMFDAGLAAMLGLSGAGAIAMIPFALRAYGGSYAEQISQATQLGQMIGQDVAKNAAKAATVSSMIEVGTEMIWGMAGALSKVTGGSPLDDEMQERLAEAISGWAKTETGRKILTTIGEKALGGITEGLEEVIGDASEQILKTLGIMPGDPMEWEQLKKEMGHSFITGALGGLMGEATGIVSTPMQQAQVGKQLKAGGITTADGTTITVDDMVNLANSPGMEGTSLEKTYSELFKGVPRSSNSFTDQELGKLYSAYEETLGRSEEAAGRVHDLAEKVDAGESLSRADVNRVTNNPDSVRYLQNVVGEDLKLDGNITERKAAVEMALRTLASENNTVSNLYEGIVNLGAEDANTAELERQAQEIVGRRQLMPEAIAQNYFANSTEQAVRDAAQRLGIDETGQEALANAYMGPRQEAEASAQAYQRGLAGEQSNGATWQENAAYEMARQEHLKSLAEEEIRNDREEADGLRVRTGIQGNDSQSASGQVERVEGTSGSTELRESETGFEGRGPVSGAYSQPVSAADFGIRGGSTKKNLRVIARGSNSKSIERARELVESRGIKCVVFAGGALEVNGEQARGYYDPETNTIYVRADHRLFTADQIARHEVMHDRIRKGEVSLKDARDYMVEKLGWEKFEQTMRNYYALYEKTGMSNDAVFEEAICDAAGEMNDFVYAGHFEDARIAAPFYNAAKEAGEQARTEGNADASSGGWQRYSADKKYDPETASIKEQIANSAEELNKMPVIKSLDNVMTKFGSKRAATEWAIKELSKWGGHVDRQGFGNVYFSNADIREGLNYSNTDAEIAAMVMLPYVLKRGIKVGEHGNHKNRSKHTTTFAGPVEINGTRGNMAVVVNNNGNHYYTHRIVMPDGSTFVFRENKEKASREPYGGVADNSSLANTTGLASASNVAEENGSVKQKSEGKFSMDRPVETTDRLIALHNMSEETVRGMLEIGGLAMPSVAITRADMGHSTYGEISAVYGKSSISPTNRKNVIYSGDAYTPTFPDVGIKINRNAAEKAYDKLSGLLGDDAKQFHFALDSDNLQDQIKRYGSFYKAYKDRDVFKVAFLRDTGRTLTVPMKEKNFSNKADNQTLKKIAKAMDLKRGESYSSQDTMAREPEVRKIMREYAVNKYGEHIADKMYPVDEALSFNEVDSLVYATMNLLWTGQTREVDTKRLEKRLDVAMKTKKIQTEYESWMNELGKDFVEKKGIRNNQDFFTPYGNRRSFEQLYYPYTLANIVRAMEGQVKQGKTGLLTGSGNIRGAAARPYASIEDARRDIGRLNKMDYKEAVNPAIEAFDNHTLELCQKMVEGKGNRFTAVFDAAEVLTEVIPKYQTADGIYRYLKRENYDDYYNVTPEIAKEIEDVIKEARQLPTSYFEGKMYRAVPITEALAYVVPDNMNKDLKQQLVDAGANVVEYKHGDEADRLAKVNSVEGSRFSRDIDGEYAKAVKSGDVKTAQQIVDEAAKNAGYDMHLYHGAKKGGGFTKFKDWSYFTANKQYAERYQQRDNPDSLYDVYVKSDRMFDTRNKKDRAIFEKYRKEYGMSELQKSGLPDWTDGYDIADFIEENDLDYDGIVLDEGGDMVDGKPVPRGESYVVRKSNQVKSAEPVTRDDDGNIISLSERFNPKNDDIRFSRDLSYMMPENADETAKKVVENLSRKSKLNDMAAKYGSFKSAAYTDERIAQEIEYSYATGERSKDYARAYIAFVSPEDFIDATSSRSWRGNLYQQVADKAKEEGRESMLDLDALQNERQSMFLRIEATEDGRASIVGHEGRHRMIGLEKEGYKYVPVIIEPREGSYPDGQSRYSTKPIDMLWLNGQEFGAGNGTSFVLHDILPLSANYADIAKEIFAGGKNVTKFSRDLSSGELYEANRQLQKDLTELRSKLKTRTEQYKYWKGQTKVTEGRQLRIEDVTKLAREIIKGQESSADAKTVAEKMKALGEYLLNSSDENVYDEARLKAYEIAHDVLANAKMLNTKGGDDFYKDFRTLLKGYSIYVAPSVREEVAPDGWNDFRKSLFGTVNLTADNTKGKTVDVVYNDLQGIFGDWLLPEYITSEADQLNRILEVIETYRPIYENFNSYEMADAVEWTANEILTRIIGEEIRETNPTYADRMEKKLSDQKVKSQEALRRVREQRDRKVQNLKEHYQQVAEDRRNRKIDSEMRTRLLKWARRVNNMKLPRVAGNLRDLMIGDLDTVAKSITGQKLGYLQALEDWYLAEQQNDPNFFQDKEIEAQLKRLHSKHINDLTQEEVADLITILQNFEAEWRHKDTGEMIDSAIKVDRYAAAMNTIDDVANTRGRHRGKGGKADRIAQTVDAFFVDNQLSPTRAMKRITGYHDGDPLSVLTKEVSDGYTKKIAFMMEANRKFDRWLNNKKFCRALMGKRARTITVRGAVGMTVREFHITPAMGIGLYLASMNDDNMRHIAQGGIQIADLERYRKGDLKGAFDTGEIAKFTREAAKAVENQLTDEEKAFANAVYEYYNIMAPNAINDVSEVVSGYAKARVKNYYPIRVLQTYLDKNAGEVREGGTPGNAGFLNERTTSTKPIVLMDVVDVLRRSIDENSTYVGLEIPIRNFNLLKNTRVSLGDGSLASVQDMIQRKWGDEADKYISKMISDVQGKGKGQSTIFNNVVNVARGNQAKAALHLNAGTGIKQAASLPTAAAVLGTKPIVRSITTLARKVDPALIRKYTPLYDYRALGYSTLEIGDIREKKAELPKALKWIEAIDLWTVRRIWRASEYYVLENNKDLKPYSEEFYKEVKDIWEQTVQETQPNYTPMQRSQSLRSDGVERVVHLFKTQPYQNFNILYDAFAEAHAKRVQMVANTNDETKANYKKAKTGLARAVGSQIVSSFVFALMQYVVDLARGKKKKYQDDDGEDDILAWMKAIGLNMLSNGFGALPLGSLILEGMENAADMALKAMGKKAFFGQKYYGLSDPTIDAINDAGSYLGSLINKIGNYANGNNSSETFIRNMVDAVSELSAIAGIPVGNGLRTLQSITRIVLAGGTKAGLLYDGNMLLAEYNTLRLTTDPAKYKSDYYDLLKKAWLNDPEAYEEIRKKMINAAGDPFATSSKTAEENIDAKVKTWSKEKASQESFYNDAVSYIQSTDIWDKASAAKQKTAMDNLLKIASGTDEELAAKASGGKSVGLDETEYILFKLALSIADDGNGSYTNAETESAINMIPGLTNEEKSYLWEAQGKSAKSNPFNVTRGGSMPNQGLMQWSRNRNIAGVGGDVYRTGEGMFNGYGISMTGKPSEKRKQLEASPGADVYRAAYLQAAQNENKVGTNYRIEQIINSRAADFTGAKPEIDTIDRVLSLLAQLSQDAEYIDNNKELSGFYADFMENIRDMLVDHDREEINEWLKSLGF